MFNLQYHSAVFFSREMALEFLFSSKLKFSRFSWISHIASCRLLYGFNKQKLKELRLFLQSAGMTFEEGIQIVRGVAFI